MLWRTVADTGTATGGDSTAISKSKAEGTEDRDHTPYGSHSTVAPRKCWAVLNRESPCDICGACAYVLHNLC